MTLKHYPDGTKEWYRNGALYRRDSPARERVETGFPPSAADQRRAQVIRVEAETRREEWNDRYENLRRNDSRT
jgi:hypothetical protein